MVDLINERFRVIAERLEGDLRTRFPAAQLRLVRHQNESLWVRIDGTDEHWGEAGFGDWLGSPLTDAEVEAAVSELASQVADNAWPDECTEPWPLCPQHPEHALNPGLHRGVAVWRCDRDHRTNVRIGSLDRTPR